MVKSKEPVKFRCERLGKVQTWTQPDEPFKGNARKRADYENGFRARTFDFNQGIVTHSWDDKSPAWRDGYADAQAQERPAVKLQGGVH